MPDSTTCRNAVISNDYKDFIVGYYDRKEILNESRVDCYQIVNRNYAVIHYYDPAGESGETAYYAQIPKCYGLLQQQNLEETGVSRLRRIESFDYYGQGVLLGFVDTGIDYAHPAFLLADGTSRVVSIWDQNDQSGTPPPDFIYGTEFGAEEIAAGTAPKDEIGHGTFMAGIAAGKPDPAHDFYGVASLAEIAVVKLKQLKPYLREYYLLSPDVPAYSETDIMLGVRYLTELARRRNQPLVLCIGLGTNAGNHTGSLALSRYLTSLSYDLDLCLVLAAGNEGNARHHFFSQISRAQQDVELQIGKEPVGFVMEFWTSAISNIKLALISPSGERVELSDQLKFSQTFRFIFDRTTVHVSYERQERSSNARLAQFRFVHPAEGIWRLVVDGTGEMQGNYHLWLPLTGFVSENTFFVEPDPYITVCEPGNANLPMTVSGYNSESGGFYTESSRGFTADGQIKPSIAAPAVNVIGPFAGGGYVTKSGTSSAASYTAGCAALFFEFILEQRSQFNPETTESAEGPFLDTVLVKNLFTYGATREERLVYPNREWGYGKLNLYGVFLRLQN